ncbi:MAG: hypothetical protein N2109_12720 [Fimbriimonadales bacterium]|nr:hypothetical protein [Fimbriimonadales bacterium]
MTLEELIALSGWRAKHGEPDSVEEAGYGRTASWIREGFTLTLAERRGKWHARVASGPCDFTINSDGLCYMSMWTPDDYWEVDGKAPEDAVPPQLAWAWNLACRRRD